MRKAKALVIPFRFREGYPDEIVDAQLQQAKELLNKASFEYVYTKNVIVDKDADEVRKEYNGDNYDFTILLIPTWLEPMLAIRAAKPYFNKPVVVWGFGTFEHNGWRVDMGAMPGSGLVKGTLREMNVAHEFLYYLPGENKTDVILLEKLNKVANVSRAMSLLEKTKILTIGYLFGGMSVGDMDLTKMRNLIGPEIMEKDAYSLVEAFKKIDEKSDEFKQAREEVESNLSETIGDKINAIVKIYMVLKGYVEEYDLQALTLKCHFELSQEFGHTPCIPISVLGNSIVTSCEADIPVLITQIIMKYLSDGKDSAYADIHDMRDGRVLCAACGYAPGNMCIGGKITCELPDENAQGLGATFSGYITNKNYLKEGRVTFGRLLKEADGSFTMHYTTGESVGDVGKVRELDCPQYSFTEIVLDGDLDKFAQNLGSHHYSLVHLDIREEIEMFCKYKGIKTLYDGQ